jgi:tetratricopeptide (TPR) repeat protein
MPNILLSDDPRFAPIMQLMASANYTQALAKLDAMQGVLSPQERLVRSYWTVSCLTWLGNVRRARTIVNEALSTKEIGNTYELCFELQSAFLKRVEESPHKAAAEIQTLLHKYAEEMNIEDLFWVYVQAKAQLGSCLSLAGQYSEACTELEEALQLERDPLARYYIRFWLGDSYYKLNAFDEAKKHLEGALFEKQSASAAGISDYYVARLQYELALIAYSEDRATDAKKHLNVAIGVGVQDVEMLNAIRKLESAIAESGRK